MLKINKKNIHNHIDEHLAKRDYESRLPLSGGFMLVSLLGMLVSIIFTFSGRFNEWFSWSGGPTMGYAWGTAFIVLFLVLFISSVVSITPTGKDFERMEKAGK